jgi:hypothetical protein
MTDQDDEEVKVEEEEEDLEPENPHAWEQLG